MTATLLSFLDAWPLSQLGTTGERSPTPQELAARTSSGLILALTGTFLFAVKAILIKLAFGEGTDATTLLSLRLGLACPFYVATLLLLPRPTQRARKRDVAAAMVLGFFGYYLASFLDMAGLERISAQLERLTLFTYPALIAILAWFFLREPLGWRVIVSLILCYAGIYLMYARERTWTDAGDLRVGILLVVGAALSYSIYVVLAKPIMQRMGSPRFTSLAMIGSTVFAACHFSMTHGLSDLQLSGRAWLYAIMLAFGCTVIPSFLTNEAILRLGATRTTIVGTVGPVITMILASLILREPTSWQHVWCMLVVLAGVGLVAWMPRAGTGRTVPAEIDGSRQPTDTVRLVENGERIA